MPSATIASIASLFPVAGVGQHDPGFVGNAGRFELSAGGVDHRLEVGGVERLDADLRRDDDLLGGDRHLGVVAL